MTTSNHNLNFHDVTLQNDSFKVVFQSFKHSKASSTHLVKASESFPCPFVALSNYLKIRGVTPGPLFILNNRPVSGFFFSKKFKVLLSVAGFDAKKYSPHSLRISAARMWAAKGLSDTQIRMLGRWHSNAFKTYLKGIICH